MAGTLTISTLSDGTNSTSCTNVINGAKAWVNFNGTGTVSIRASYNVSSITDNGTGDYTINFTNAFADANYALVVCCREDYTNNTAGSIVASTQRFQQTTTATRVNAFGSTGGTKIDPVDYFAAVFR
jgi:hypothetical protein